MASLHYDWQPCNFRNIIIKCHNYGLAFFWRTGKSITEVARNFYYTVKTFELRKEKKKEKEKVIEVN